MREEPGWLLQTSWPRNPLFLGWPHRLVQDVSVNFQDKCQSLLCNFVSLYERESVILLKIRAFRMDYPVYFRLQAIFLTCSKSNKRQKLKGKKQIQYGVTFVLCDQTFMFPVPQCNSPPIESQGQASGERQKRPAGQETGHFPKAAGTTHPGRAQCKMKMRVPCSISTGNVS